MPNNYGMPLGGVPKKRKDSSTHNALSNAFTPKKSKAPKPLGRAQAQQTSMTRKQQAIQNRKNRMTEWEGSPYHDPKMVMGPNRAVLKSEVPKGKDYPQPDWATEKIKGQAGKDDVPKPLKHPDKKDVPKPLTRPNQSTIANPQLGTVLSEKGQKITPPVRSNPRKIDEELMTRGDAIKRRKNKMRLSQPVIRGGS